MPSKKSKRKRKSHPRTTKACRCEDRDHCDHEWINADAGAGTVVKSTGKMYWGHKASTLGFPGQEVLLDAVAMSDAASHDSRSLLPHLNRLFQRHPDLKGLVTRVLDDGAADDRLTKRGNVAFQACLDKTLLAMHVLLGLGVEMHWNDPKCPAQNAVIERSQGLAQTWGEPKKCQTVRQFQNRINREDRLQREQYPNIHGLPRMTNYPDLKHSGRRYSTSWEQRHWNWEPRPPEILY